MKLLKFAFLGVAAAFAPRSPAAAPLAPVAPASTTALNSIKITVRSGESVDSVIMRLRREVNKSGHLRTLRNKRYHEDAREKKKRKLAEARRKMKFAPAQRRAAGHPYTMVAPRPSAHPFNQVPFLADDGGVEVFESGAILLYLADKYDAGCGTPEDRAKHAKWVVWANAALDPICFVENDRGQVVGTKLDQPGRAVNVLDEPREPEYLADGAFSVSDVAVASYLNYVPLFFPSVNLGNTPNVCRYMKRCAERPAARRRRAPAASSAVDRAQGGDALRHLQRAKLVLYAAPDPSDGAGAYYRERTRSRRSLSASSSRAARIARP
ncbi:glutathione S-transferase [Aureococcus anophagefferens]|nr:glutathione S-transferase [Aureococcus anophagefferens]